MMSVNSSYITVDNAGNPVTFGSGAIYYNPAPHLGSIDMPVPLQYNTDYFNGVKTHDLNDPLYFQARLSGGQEKLREGTMRLDDYILWLAGMVQVAMLVVTNTELSHTQRDGIMRSLDIALQQVHRFLNNKQALLEQIDNQYHTLNVLYTLGKPPAQG